MIYTIIFELIDTEIELFDNDIQYVYQHKERDIINDPSRDIITYFFNCVSNNTNLFLYRDLITNAMSPLVGSGSVLNINPLYAFDFNNNFGPVEEESELIPLMTSDDEEAILKESLPESVSILPLRNAVLFPGVVIPISATRDKSVKLIKNANSNNKLIGVVSQKDSNVSDPTINDVNKIGTVAKILRVLQMPS